MEITLLSRETIDQIAAGEVVSRPSSVVKELVENSLDAGANALTVEIQGGGITLIRVTDNGEGIDSSQIRAAFTRHATSKIRDVDDLNHIQSLGFRGEALSSIAAVSRMELITRTPEHLLGSRYVIEGGEEKSLEEIGAPEGSTFLVRNLFYNTPARRKFLKFQVTEAGYISSLMEHLALSHPDVSFKYIQNGQVKMHTAGNGNIKEIVHRLYGSQTSSALLEVELETESLKISGFIGNPSLSRGNREFEHYFVNGRYVRSDAIAKAIEDACSGRMMQHRYPFTVLFITVDGSRVDVNVHPAKQQVRFSDPQYLYDQVLEACRQAMERYDTPVKASVLSSKEEASVIKQEHHVQVEQDKKAPEPFERVRKDLFARGGSPYRPVYDKDHVAETMAVYQAVQQSFSIRDEVAKDEAEIIGQVFDTYWIAQLHDRMYIIDQHAAHEKILYERLLKADAEKQLTSQQLSPPLVVSLNPLEEERYLRYADVFSGIGFEIEHFGDREYTIRAVPDNLYGFTDEYLFTQLLDHLDDVSAAQQRSFLFEKLADMACKAAVKGNHTLSAAEARSLIKELFTLDNPYNCPHGRPVIIEFSKYELDKKFKRII